MEFRRRLVEADRYAQGVVDGQDYALAELGLEEYANLTEARAALDLQRMPTGAYEIRSLKVEGGMDVFEIGVQDNTGKGFSATLPLTDKVRLALAQSLGVNAVDGLDIQVEPDGKFGLPAEVAAKYGLFGHEPPNEDDEDDEDDDADYPAGSG